jgi:serine phosphatase RsbU (regulator of sigma subunit)
MSSRPRALRRYGLAVSVVALALCVASVLPSPPLEESRTPLFLAAVVISSWLGDRGPGILAGLLSSLAIEVFLRGPLRLGLTLDEALRTTGFVLVSLFISWLNTRRLRAERTIQANEVEFRVARQIQKQLLPATAPQVAGFEVFGASSPANATSGDYIDYYRLEGGGFGIAVGDVSGHGLGPALLMAGIRAYLRVLTQVYDDVGQVLTTANRLLYEDTHAEQFVTLFLARLDPQFQTFVYASAGQVGYLLDNSGRATKLESTGLPLGVSEDVAIASVRPIQLVPGAFVLLLTDGILEAESPEKVPFGIDRALDVLRASRTRPCGEIVDALWGAVRQFCRHVPQRDDMSVVVIKVGS